MSHDDQTQPVRTIGVAREENRKRTTIGFFIGLTICVGLLFIFINMVASDSIREDNIKEKLGRDCISQGGVWHQGSCFYSRGVSK